jgi:hypothetical protein
VDDRQRDFIARVGGYQRGRSWKEVRDNGELAVATLDALREVAGQGAPLRWEVGTVPAVRWRSDRPALAANRTPGYVPVLEVHLALAIARPVLPVSALEPLGDQVHERRTRQHGQE